jgi:glutamate-1-semialdehyde 2,1-aminomutase
MIRDPENHTTASSWSLYDEAVNVSPMGSQTHSKVPREVLRDVEPCFLERGTGCRVWDVDGNEYIDFRAGLGPITLGYAYPDVVEAVKAQAELGFVYSYAHPLEVAVAKDLVELIPCAEQVRFLKTGGEAMAAAHRLARAYTKRDVILSCGYHGWVNTMTRAGVPQAIQSVYEALPWGNVDAFEAALRKYPSNVASISVACDYVGMDQATPFLGELRRLCDEHGAVLIFDEIVTGFRLRTGGAQELFGVTPDLAVFAKGISNGVPLSCYVGKRDIMETVRDVVVSSTFGGDTLGLAAARAVIGVYQTNDVIGRLWDRGAQLHEGVREITDRLDIPAGFAGYAPLGVFAFQSGQPESDRENYDRLCGEMFKRGILLYSVCYPSFSHTESDIGVALEAFEDSFQVMKSNGCFGNAAS